MVRVMNENTADAVTSRLFLLSVRSLYNEEGIPMGVERVSNLFANKNDSSKRGIAVTCSILEDMEKCRARVIGDDGKPVMIEDEESGELKQKIVIIDDAQEVTFFFNVKIIDEEKNEFAINNKASCFPLFNFAFINSGDLPKDNKQGFICDVDELKDALMGLEFLGKEEDWSFSGGKPYQVLIPHDIPLKKERIADDFEDE